LTGKLLAGRVSISLSSKEDEPPSLSEDERADAGILMVGCVTLAGADWEREAVTSTVISAAFLLLELDIVFMEGLRIAGVATGRNDIFLIKLKRQPGA
jgi:hypothetical protein